MQIDYPAGGASAPRQRVLDRPAWHIVALSPPVPLAQSIGASARRWVGPMAIALILFEAAVRILIYSPRPQVSDPLLGQIPAPGSTWVNGREGYGRMHWNRQGIRGRDLPPDGLLPRIIVMGNSFCEAEGVDDNQTYCALLEKELTRTLHHDVWVGNCGRPSLNAGDFLYYLPAYERRFHPALILITYTLGDFRVSDHKICGTMAQFDPEAPPHGALIAQPIAESREHHSLDQAVSGPLQQIGQLLIDHSALALYGAARLYALHWRKWPQDKFITRQEQIATTAQMKRYFAAMRSRSKTLIACAYIAPYSPLRGTNNQWDRVTEQRLRKATACFHIPFIDTAAAFRLRNQQTGQPGAGFDNTPDGPGIGHLNPDGHRTVAKALAPEIARLISTRLP